MPTRVKYGSWLKWMPTTLQPGAREVQQTLKTVRCCIRPTIVQRGTDKRLSGLFPFDCFVTLGFSSQSFFFPFQRPFALKKRAPLKREALFLLSAFLVFTRPLNSFVEATTSTTQLHLISLRKLRFIQFSSAMPVASVLQRLALSHSHQGWLRSVKTSLLPEIFVSLSADLYFSPAVSRSQYCTPLRMLRFFPVLR